MKYLLSVTIFCSICAANFLVAQTDEGNLLSPKKTEDIYLAPGKDTSLIFSTPSHIETLRLGDPIVDVKYDDAHNMLDLWPRKGVMSGETNCNLTINGQVYVFILHIEDDDKVQYRRTFTLPDENTGEDDAAIALAKPVSPADIDLAAYARTITRVEVDQDYAKQQTDLRTKIIDKVYAWNKCLIHLYTVSHFPRQDIFIFKIVWVNRGDQALYLASDQYSLWVANTRIPVTLSMQDAIDHTIYPGQVETVWLAVQGYKLKDNDFTLGLPPDAPAIVKMMGSDHK
jgi:hypothetical protein